MSVTDGETVSFPEGSVFVRETGESDGKPLLLINGLGAHTAMWAPLEQVLQGYRIIEFDLPGAGQSEIPARPISMKGLAQLALAVMNRFGLAQTDVLGYSMGGMVAQQLAADVPRRVRRLVLVATTPGVGAVQPSLIPMLNIVTPARYSSTTLWSSTIGSLVGGRARYDKEWLRQQAALRFEYRPTWRGYLGQMRSMSGWSSLPLLSRITSPTLVVTGDDDPLTPLANSAMMTHGLPQARLVVLAGEGHLVVMDPESQGHHAIRDFLDAETVNQSKVWQRATVVDERYVRSQLATVKRQVPPLSLLNHRARERWLSAG